QRRVWVIFSGLMLALLIASLDQTIVATALPIIVSDLGGLSQLSWVVTGYLLASTVSTPLWGKLGDLYGRKRLFQAAIVIFLVGSALCGLSQNMTELILFRSLQGLGGGGLIVLVQAIIGDIVPPRERGRYQGLFGAAFGLSSVAGPLLGGFFVDSLSWRWIFYVNLPLGLIALAVIGAAFQPSENHQHHQIDYLGAAVLTLALSSIVLFTSLGGVTYGWVSPTIIGLFLLSRLTPATSTISAAAFILVLGLGLGMVMQVLVLAVQNSVDYRLLGVATSGSTLFRQIGGSIGVSVFGAIFSNRLAHELVARLPLGAHLPKAANPAAVKELPPAVHLPYVEAFAASLRPVFLAAAGISL